MRKAIIILIQAVVFIAGVALLFVGHPITNYISFIMVFGALDAYIWKFYLEKIWNVKKNDWRVITYRAFQIAEKVAYSIIQWQGLNWISLCFIVPIWITWWSGFEDVTYFWLNRIKINSYEYMDWMCNWSVHWLIKRHKDGISVAIHNLTLLASVMYPNVKIYEHEPYNCPRSWFLWCAWLGLVLSIIINILGIII